MKAVDLKLGDFILLKTKRNPDEAFYLLEIIRIADKDSYYVPGTPVYMVHIHKNPYSSLNLTDHSQGSVTDSTLSDWGKVYDIEFIIS